MSGLDRIREAARRDKDLQFNNLMHHLTLELLREAYWALKKDAAPGVDQVTWEAYGEELDGNLTYLHRRVQSGKYRARPTKRVWIAKDDGKQRPLGVTALEDKIVQQALVWVLNQIYEEDFLGFSYGFRPDRSQHHALDAVWVGITRRKVNWILDVDISKFFDTVDHHWLIKFLQHRITDQRVIRLISKWLTAGVSEEGEWSRTTVGTPQGAVISPILANIYLHYTFDLWANRWRKQKAKGDVIIIRYADDAVIGFQHYEEAQQFREELTQRLGIFGLELHPQKTRLLEFGRFAAGDRAKRGEGKPETFDFLGFTHICSTTRKTKKFTVKRKTIQKRKRKKIREVKETLKRMQHRPVKEQAEKLQQILKGHFNYYGVPGNRMSNDAFRTAVIKVWRKTLMGRSQKARRKLTWDKFKKLVRAWLPTAKTVHPYPSERLRVSYPR